MSAYYVIVLVTLLVCVAVYDATPPTDDRTRDSYLTEKRGGIPSRFRGNSFRHSLHPLIQQRAAKTPTESRDEDDDTHEEDEGPPKSHQLANRDYLYTIIRMGQHQPHQPNPFDHNRYNNQYYYDKDYSDDNSYDYEYYYYDYDYDYDDDDDDDEESDEHDRKREVGREKIRAADAKRGPTNLVERATEQQMAALKAYKRKTPTVKSSSATRHRLASRDYLGILGMGGGQHSSNNHFDHNQYNKHYYYTDNYDNDDDYYDYDYYDYDTDYRKRAVDEQKTPPAAVKRKTPTMAKSDIEGELETLQGSETKTPTVERSRFLQAIKRYMLSSQFDEDAIRK